MTSSIATPRPPAGPPRAVRRPSRSVVVLTLGGVVVGVGLLSLAVGSREIPLHTVVDVLLHPDGSEDSSIVRDLRLPRTVLGVAVGLALGIAGALMQGHTRNPLADPGLLGVEAGAAFAVVLGIHALGVTSLSGYAWLALVGAGSAATAVFAVGSTRGGPNPVSLVLAGTAVSALLVALSQSLVLQDQDTLDEYRFWVVGSVAGRGLDVFWPVLPFLVVGLGLAAASASTLNLLQLGDDAAAALGLHPLRHRAVGVLAVMLLTGAATAACGPIGFVGLVVPHVARALVGVDYRWVIPASGLVGAVLVVVADVLGRVVARPGELQVGIVMAVVGGPVFVALVRRTPPGPPVTTLASPLRVGPVSALVPVRAGLVSAVAAVVLAGLVAVDLALGDFAVPLPDVVRTLLGGGDAGQRFVVLQLRLPQTSVAVLVGAALGLSGALIQTFARNPLASPDILGVTDGASLGAVAAIVLAGVTGYGGGLVSGTLQEVGLPLAAFAGGIGTATLLYLLSWRRGVDGQRFVLVGIGLSYALAAVTSWLLTRARIQDAASAQVWLNGSLTGRGWDQAGPLAATLVVLVPVALVLVRTLNAVQLGDDPARGLGVRLQTTQLLTLVTAVGLASVAVSAVGPLEFVAFVVPQVALRLTGGSRPPLLASMVLGGCLVVAADLVVRVVLPVALPAGLVTAAIGAPYLIWLLLRTHRKAAA